MTELANHEVVSQAAWLDARKALLMREKAFTRERDALSEAKRALPWVRIDKDYRFQAPEGVCTLAELFDGRSQLIVQHFMFGADWNDGCPSCSFWADGFERVIIHLNARDVSFAAVSTAPVDTLQATQQRLCWTFPWVSNGDGDFNRDFAVSFTAEDLENEAPNYNFGTGRFNGPEAPGLSVFYKDTEGQIFRTYSTYARGLDMFNTAYHLLDAVPKGRDEGGLAHTMSWVRLNDCY